MAVGRCEGLKVLIAEDNERFVKNMVAYLRMNGAQVDGVGDGAEACFRFLTEPDGYHVVVMDIQMPRMGGIEAARQIRGSVAKMGGCMPKFVAISGETFMEEGGFDLWLSKPFEMDRLARMVGRAGRNVQAG